MQGYKISYRIEFPREILVDCRIEMLARFQVSSTIIENMLLVPKMLPSTLCISKNPSKLAVHQMDIGTLLC